MLLKQDIVNRLQNAVFPFLGIGEALWQAVWRLSDNTDSLAHDDESCETYKRYEEEARGCGSHTGVLNKN